MTTLYILKYDKNKINSLYKIGITSFTAQHRCNEIQKTMKEGKLSVYWHRKFLAAYIIEQTLHVFFKPFHAPQPEYVSGYTEFFDLNFIIVEILTSILNLCVLFRYFFLLITAAVLLEKIGFIKFI